MKHRAFKSSIVFFVTEEDVDRYLAMAANGSISNTVYIALRPCVYSYAMKKGLDVKDTTPYFTNTSHADILDRSNEIISWLSDRATFTDRDHGIEQAYRETFVFFTRFAVHYFMWSIEIILNAIEAHHPGTICASCVYSEKTRSPYVEPREGYFGMFASDISSRLGLLFQDISNTSSIDRRGGVTGCGRLIKYAGKYIGFWLWMGKCCVKNAASKTRPIFFTTKKYHMEYFAEEMIRRNPGRKFDIIDYQAIPDFRLTDFMIKMLSGRFSAAILKQKELIGDLSGEIRKENDIFSYRAVSFAAAAAKKIDARILDLMIGLNVWTSALGKFIRVSAPAAVISNGNRIDDMILAELCKANNIPTVLISHGTLAKPVGDRERIEWGEFGRHLLGAPYMYTALQTPLAQSYVDIFPAQGRAVKTGPLLWGRPVDADSSRELFSRMFGKKYGYGQVKVITHAGTPKPSKGFRPLVFETPDEYIAAIFDLAQAVRRIEGVVLLVRFRPSTEITVQSLRERVHFDDKILLSVDEPFSDVLGMTDLLVSFSSTTIEEALQNRTPVLLYGGKGRYKHVPARTIRTGDPVADSAVFHVQEAAGLDFAIKSIVALNIKGRETKTLFDPYIYPEDKRESLESLVIK